MVERVDEWAWRPSTGEGARTHAEREAFLAARAAEGMIWQAAHGTRPRRGRVSGSRRQGRNERRAHSVPTAAEAMRLELRQALVEADFDSRLESETTDYFSCHAQAGTATGSAGGSLSPISSWRKERESSVTAIFAALHRLTSRPEDRIKLQRGLAGVLAGFDWPSAFSGRTSVTGEEIRRMCFRRIVSALQSFTGSESFRRTVGPRSDDPSTGSLPVVTPSGTSRLLVGDPGQQSPNRDTGHTSAPTSASRSDNSGGWAIRVAQTQLQLA